MRLAIVVALALSALGCSKGLDTIESAEAFAKSRGIALADKTENKEQIVAPRCFDYKAGDVEVGILQFNSADGAEKWKTTMDGAPLDSGQLIRNGGVIFQVWGGDDADRQKVVAALQP